MKQNGVSDEALHLSLFPYSLTHHAIAWYDRLLRNSIHSFDDMMRKFLSKYFPPSMVTKLRNEITKFEQKPHESLFEAWERYKLSIDWRPNHNMLLGTQIDTFYNGLNLSHRDTIDAVARGTFMQKTPEECYELIENMTADHNHWDTSAIRDETSRNISSTSTTKNLKAITTRSGVTLVGPLVSPPPPPPSKDVNQEPEIIMNQVLTKSTNNVSPLVVQPSPSSTFSTPISSSKIPEVTKDTVQPSTENIQPPKMLSLPELTSMQMILEIEDRLTTRPAGIAKDVFVKVGKTGRALIDVYGEELTLRVDDEAINFKVCQTLKYSYNDAELINQIDIIDVACEEYVQQVLGFFDNSKSGNPTPISDSTIALSSPSLTPFEGGDFILEKIEACLTSKSIPSRINDTDLDLEGDIRLLEELLNNDPSLSPLPLKELNVEEIKTVKSSIDEPPKLELKELLSHLEYTMRQFQMVKAVDTKCETCGVPHSFTECPAVDGYTQETAYATMVGPSVFPPPHPPSKDVNQEPEIIMNQVLTESTNNVSPLVVQPSPSSTFSTPISSSKMPEVTKDTVQPSTENIQPPKMLSLPELTSTQMILEIEDRLTTRPAGIAKDVFVKVGKFHFLTDFVVVDYVVDP
nr:reverse transcriptase domain-containing protein [Tanacetum cinerariifolium]